MAKSITIVFPHQLFKQHPAIKRGRTVWLMEETRFFVDYRYHKKKLVMHRASMKYYQDYLRENGYNVRYFDYMDVNGEQILGNLFKKENITDVHIGDVYDVEVKKLYEKVCSNVNASCTWYETPMFMTDLKLRNQYWAESRSHTVEDFYNWQRSRYDFLPKINVSDPVIRAETKTYSVQENKYVKDAKKYIDEYFAENYGATAGFSYAVTHTDARLILRNCLENMHDTTSQGSLRAALNTGLLEPADIADEILEFAKKRNIKTNTFAELLTYIVSIREFMYILYENEGEKLREYNIYSHTRMIPRSWYLAKTGIAPVDTIIRNILRSAYLDDFQGLAVLQSAMMLSEFDPDHMHQWFMELSVSAYDWIVVPMVYGRGAYTQTDSAYILNSSHILKAGEYKIGEWCDLWDALYWHFIATQTDMLAQNNFLSDAITKYQAKSVSDKESIRQTAEKYLSSLGVSAYT
ncbi:MAG: cryptochrome/photolyase family protein [Patescibacteria group bacterium]